MGENKQPAPRDTRTLRRALNVFEGYIAEWRLYSEEMQEKNIDDEVRLALAKYVDRLAPFLEEDDPLDALIAGLVFLADVLEAPPPITYRRATNLLLGLVNGLKDELADQPSSLRDHSTNSLTVRVRSQSDRPRRL